MNQYDQSLKIRTDFKINEARNSLKMNHPIKARKAITAVTHDAAVTGEHCAKRCSTSA